MKRIVCFHLFNDYSGSPKILKMVLDNLVKMGYQVDLVTSKGGVLDQLDHPCLKRHSYYYNFSSNPWVTMLRYAFVQLYTFVVAFRYVAQRDTIFYINTILPIGPALAGRIMGKKVVYHYHENAFIKGKMYRLFTWAMQKLAHGIICVSVYQASFIHRKKNVTVIPNALPKEFVIQLRPNASEAFNRKTVLMLTSLKGYKGTREFIALAATMPQLNFVMVVNDTQGTIDDFISGAKLVVPANCVIYPKQENVIPFYNAASLVVNLSDKKKIVETFGLTVLEGMSCGLPAIVPTEGGIAELVEDGYNGFRIDVQDIDKIRDKIVQLFTDKNLYIRLSANALEFSKSFNEEKIIKTIALKLESV